MKSDLAAPRKPECSLVPSGTVQSDAQSRPISLPRPEPGSREIGSRMLGEFGVIVAWSGWFGGRAVGDPGRSLQRTQDTLRYECGLRSSRVLGLPKEPI
jgi:hypothetical protein